jgi:tRNA threonylcarbamoyladenosine biosynthesis protein TsaE
MSEEFTSNSMAETMALGERLARRLGVGDCVALVGELGTGKTVLVRGIARGLGVADQRLVASPSYVLVREYAGRLPIYHVDLYRLSGGGPELAGLGLEEMLADGVVLVEWADRAGDALPRPHWRVSIRYAGPNTREFSLQRAG